MKIVSIVGARPQFVKVAAITHTFSSSIEEVIIHTGQHYDSTLSEVFFRELNIPAPRYNLGVGSGSHAYQIGTMVMALEDILKKEKPLLVLVYGDTNSAIGGALAAAKLQIPIGHVEAGLRNFDLAIMEEQNRLVCDHLSTLLFAPTETAVKNLKREGLENRLYFTGDVMYDILLSSLPKARSHSTLAHRLELQSRKYLLATVHRPENTENPDHLRNIVNALIASEERIVFPMHPRTQKRLQELNILKSIPDRISILEPLGYWDFLAMLSDARIIITDSGGIQKEAYCLRTPCITLFDTTSWVETVEDGWNTLSSASYDEILTKIRTFNPPATQKHTYGDGTAGKKIASIVLDFLNRLPSAH